MAVTISTTTFTVVDVLVKATVKPGEDSQGRRELSLTEADAISLMYALADTLGYDVNIKPRG